MANWRAQAPRGHTTLVNCCWGMQAQVQPDLQIFWKTPEIQIFMRNFSLTVDNLFMFLKNTVRAGKKTGLTGLCLVWGLPSRGLGRGV